MDPIKDATSAIKSEVSQLSGVAALVLKALEDDNRKDLAKKCAVLVAKAGRVQRKVVDYIGAMERLERAKSQ